MSSFGASSRVLKNRDALAILQVEAAGGGKAGAMAGQFGFGDIAQYAMFDRLLVGIRRSPDDPCCC